MNFDGTGAASCWPRTGSNVTPIRNSAGGRIIAASFRENSSLAEARIFTMDTNGPSRKGDAAAETAPASLGGLEEPGRTFALARREASALSARGRDTTGLLSEEGYGASLGAEHRHRQRAARLPGTRSAGTSRPGETGSSSVRLTVKETTTSAGAMTIRASTSAGSAWSAWNGTGARGLTSLDRRSRRRAPAGLVRSGPHRLPVSPWSGKGKSPRRPGSGRSGQAANAWPA